MAPVKVIVQGIPAERYNFSYANFSVNKRKQKLERMLAAFGPVKCTYLWEDATVPSALSSSVEDNFAHVFFKNDADSERACQAADNHQLRFEDRLLALTRVPNSRVPIDVLDYDCLIKIFSKLDITDRLTVEEVCPKWEKVAVHSWSTTTRLDIGRQGMTEQKFQLYMTKCGRYLTEIIGMMSTEFFLQLIQMHCTRIESLDLIINEHPREDRWQDELTNLFIKFGSLQCLKLIHSFTSRFEFLDHLPDSIKDIRVGAQCSQRPATAILHFSRFHDLQRLVLHGYAIGGLDGFEELTDLRYLDLSNCTLPPRVIQNIGCLMRLQTLKFANLDCPDLDDDMFIMIIRHLREIQCLDISENPALTDLSLEFISMLPKLKVLNISKLEIVSLRSMLKMPALERLECTLLRNICDESTLRLISLAPNLKSLDVSGSSITLDLFKGAKSIVETRPNTTVLNIFTTKNVECIDIEHSSPRLNIVSSWEPRHSYVPSDDLYDDVNEYQEYEIYEEDTSDIETDYGFEFF